MTRVLILGGSGMLGHKLYQRCQDRFDTWATLRSSFDDYVRLDLFSRDRVVSKVDAADPGSVEAAMERIKPDVVVNCIGIVKQSPLALDPIISLTINSLFPHRLARLCESRGCRLVHISTDCVFSGKEGRYVETDPADAEDLYGRTKYLSEVGAPSGLTLRTSMIGREIRTSYGLIEWFLRNRRGQVRGFTRAIYSGFTAGALADIISTIIENHQELRGLYHVSSEPISKHDLLSLVRKAFDVPIEIVPDPGVEVDRSLDSGRFRQATGFQPRSWPEMIGEMAADPTPYDHWRSKRAA